jgi:hypothetical protein
MKERPTMRFAGFVVMMTLALAIGAKAQTKHDAKAAGSEGFVSFVRQFRCPLLEKLDAILSTGLDPAVRDGPDRFLVVAAADRQDRYVQCIFFDLDRRLLCEAASGYYAPTPFQLSSPDMAYLSSLGFSAVPEGNHRIEIALTDRMRLRKAADLILDALYHVYNADSSDTLVIEAPLAAFPPEQSQCNPIS